MAFGYINCTPPLLFSEETHTHGQPLYKETSAFSSPPSATREQLPWGAACAVEAPERGRAIQISPITIAPARPRGQEEEGRKEAAVPGTVSTRSTMSSSCSHSRCCAYPRRAGQRLWGGAEARGGGVWRCGLLELELLEDVLSQPSRKVGVGLPVEAVNLGVDRGRDRLRGRGEVASGGQWRGGTRRRRARAWLRSRWCVVSVVPAASGRGVSVL